MVRPEAKEIWSRRDRGKERGRGEDRMTNKADGKGERGSKLNN